MNGYHEHHRNFVEFTSFSPIASMLTTPTSSHNMPTPCECDSTTRTCRSDFLVKNFPWVQNLDSSHSVMTTACMPPLLSHVQHVPHTHVSRASWTCRSVWCLKKVSILNKSSLLLALSDWSWKQKGLVACPEVQ